MLAASFALIGGSPALASSTAVDSDAPAETVQQAVTPSLTPVVSWDEEASGEIHIERPIGGVTASRAADALGKPAYGSRSALGETGAIVTFSRRRPGTFLSPYSPGISAAPFTSGMPVASRAVTSGFGMRWHPMLGGMRAHHGVDLAAPTGSPVVATADGTVSTASWAGGYGLLVALDHGGGRQTRYGHLSRLNVAAGQAVRRGEIIGFVGSTGRSTGPHLHYETRVNGHAVNPLAH